MIRVSCIELLLAAFVLAYAALVFVLLRSAPEGYEDPAGFHYAKPLAGTGIKHDQPPGAGRPTD